MYILKNAWTSIWRNKGRNILVGIIVMVIATSCTITLAISNNAEKLIQSYEDNYQIKATIGINRENFMNDLRSGKNNMSEMRADFAKVESLTLSDIKKYAESSYVKSLSYTETLQMNTKNITKVTSETNSNQFGKEMPSNGDFSIIGYSSLDAMNEFLSGTYTMIEGSIDTDFENDSCVINEELALLNNLKVGDKITFINPNDETKSYELTISGVFKDKDDTENMDLFSKSANNIITNANAIERMIEKDNSLTNQINATFFLTNKDDISAFETELKEKGLDDNYALTTNLSEVEESLSGITNLKSFSVTFLVITLVIGAIVLFIINLINIRERKYEIGILRTIGMKKISVAMQFITELFFVSLVSLAIGLFLGSCLSVPVANKLLESEINQTEEKDQEINKNFGGENFQREDFKSFGKNRIEKVSQIDANVNLVVVMELLGVGILLTIISSSASVLAIMRFSPLTILKERS